MPNYYSLAELKINFVTFKQIKNEFSGDCHIVLFSETFTFIKSCKKRVNITHGSRSVRKTGHQ